MEGIVFNKENYEDDDQDGLQSIVMQKHLVCCTYDESRQNLMAGIGQIKLDL